MQLHVVASGHEVAQLGLDVRMCEVVAAGLCGMAPEAQDLDRVGHHRELRAVAVELGRHPPRRLHHQLARRSLTVAVDLVVGGEDDLEHHAGPTAVPAAAFCHVRRVATGRTLKSSGRSRPRTRAIRRRQRYATRPAAEAAPAASRARSQSGRSAIAAS